MKSPLFRAALSLAACLAAPVGALAADACALLTSEDAARIVGSPLPENYRSGARPNPRNAQAQTSVCGWFPRDFQFATSEDPPESGVQLTVRSMPAAADARAFYDKSNEMARMVAKASSVGGRMTPLSGIGESAFLDQKRLGNGYVLTLKALKGSHIIQLQVWSPGAGVDEATSKAARQIASKL